MNPHHSHLNPYQQPNAVWRLQCFRQWQLSELMVHHTPPSYFNCWLVIPGSRALRRGCLLDRSKCWVPSLTKLVHYEEDLGMVFSRVAGKNLWGHCSWAVLRGFLRFGPGNRPRYLVGATWILACPRWRGQGNRDRGWGQFPNWPIRESPCVS